MKFLEEDGVQILKKNEELNAVRKEIGKRLRKKLVRSKSVESGDNVGETGNTGLKLEERMV